MTRSILCALLALGLSACQTGQNPPGGGPNRAPTAAFTATPDQGAAPLLVSFDASGSADPDGSLGAYQWDFGDGGGGGGVRAAHSYQAAGSYTVTLRVTDNQGSTASAQRTVQVTSGETPGGDGDVKAVQATYGVAASAPFLPDGLLGTGVDAALFASQQAGTGNLVVQGTITQTGPSSYSYSPEPADRLRLLLSDRRQFEFVFTALQGDFSGDGGGFMSGEHSAAAQVSSNEAAGALALSLQSEKLGGARHQTVQGILSQGGARWTVDLQTDGTYRYDVDSASLETDDSLRGTIASADLGISATLNHRYLYKTINTAEQVDHRIDHSWTAGGSNYRLQVQVFVVFKRAQPVDQDQWIIGGTLTKDGATVGQVTATEDPGVGLDIWLELGGERVSLFHFSYL